VDQDRTRWPGSGSAIITGSGITPFGFFDADPAFKIDAPGSAVWAARRLGYPITDIEMIDLNFYACFEESALEYGAQVNQFNIINNITLLQGLSTDINITQRNVQGMSLPYLIAQSQAYGTEAGVGGDVDYRKGEFISRPGKQVYDLQEIIGSPKPKLQSAPITASLDITYALESIPLLVPIGVPTVADPDSVLGSFVINGTSITYNVQTDSISTVLGYINQQNTQTYTTYQTRQYPIYDNYGNLVCNEPRGCFVMLANQPGETDISIMDITGSLLSAMGLISGSTFFPATNRDIEIRRIYHNPPPAAARIYDPFSMTGMSYSNVLNEMGFAGYSPATQFLMCPIFEDLLRIQAIDFNDLVRKSAYSFEITNNKIKIFPIPTWHQKVYVEYIYTDERNSAVFTTGSAYTSGSNEIGDYSNVPYDVIPYQNINSVGKQWIRKYFLALCKEVLGAIRQKYQSIPIPGAEVTLDGGELRSEAAEEKRGLVEELRSNLEASGKAAQMENQANEAQQLQDSLSKIPLRIYVG
jgi:hypothetical protein